MHARNLIAMTVSALVFAVTLGLFQAGSIHPVRHYNATASATDSLPITDLPGIVVTPSVQDLAAAGEPLSFDGAAQQPVSGGMAATAVHAIGASLFMPYYAFGTRAGTLGKE